MTDHNKQKLIEALNILEEFVKEEKERSPGTAMSLTNQWKLEQVQSSLRGCMKPENRTNIK